VVDGAGAVLSAREWTPFGVEVGTAQEGLGYTGEYWDAGVGLQYLRARWYQPHTGRFFSPDPIIPDFQNPQNINRYLYIAGNPINQTDPSGRQPPAPTPTPPPSTDGPPGPASVPTPPPPLPPVPDTLLLERSVHILVFDAIVLCPSLDDPVVPGRGVEGLGTIIYAGDTVLTNNHYEELIPAIWGTYDFVEFTDYLGNVERVGRNEVTRFPQDPGTLLLWLPTVNLGLPPATLGNPDTLSPGDWTQVVYYDDGADRMGVRMSRVRGFGEHRGVQTAIFNNHSDNPSEILSGGDSGGGLFKDGSLVGNTFYIFRTWTFTSIFGSALLPNGL